MSTKPTRKANSLGLATNASRSSDCSLRGGSGTRYVAYQAQEGRRIVDHDGPCRGARDALHLSEGQELTVVVDGNRLVLEPAKPKRPSFTLEQLLADCDFDQAYSDEERAWLDAEPVGRELL